MPRTIRYITHPQVSIDPTIDVKNCGLNQLGRSRIEALALSGGLSGTKMIISSGETKALETATPLAQALGCNVIIREKMHENDRSSTGFLPEAEFEAAADQFFANPTVSFQGWETAQAAQSRIVSEFMDCLETATDNDVAFIGHGAVGTLLYCHLARLPISRAYDQAAGGGSYFDLSDMKSPPAHGWHPIENLIG
jgi:broad specificity phosphatase PhoE